MYQLTRLINNTQTPHVYNTFSVCNKVSQPFNPKKFYSTSENIKQINDYFINDQIITYLPSTISNLKKDENGKFKIESEIIPDLYNQLANTLLSLDKENFTYKFDYSLFLHTNDENIKINSDLNMYDSKFVLNHTDKNEFIRFYELDKLNYENFKIHGYHEFLSDRLDLDIEYEDLLDYCESAYIYLCNTITSNNRTKELGFIDFYKPILLKTTRLPKNNL